MRHPTSTSLAFFPAVLLLLAVGLGGLSCGDGAAPPSGDKLFQDNCAQCHGRTGEGSKLAPDLRDKKQFWTPETLVTYLKAPTDYAAKDARLKPYLGKYTLQMPKYVMLQPAELTALASHVLALPPASDR